MEKEAKKDACEEATTEASEGTGKGLGIKARRKRCSKELREAQKETRKY